MCTLLVNSQANQLSVYMNRDESSSKGGDSGELAPKNIRDNIIAPIDIKSGGTWVAVDKSSQRIACLLNRYDEIDNSKKYKSRGEVPFLALEKNRDEFSTIDFSDYRPFRLVVADFNNIVKYEYDGKSLEIEEISKEGSWYFFTSSSWNEPEVKKYRKNLFEKWLSSQIFIKGTPLYNLYQPEGKQYYSPLVKREKSETVSITNINFVKGKELYIAEDIKYINNPQSGLITQGI